VRYFRRHAVGLSLVFVRGIGERELRPDSGARLLNDMRQLVGQEFTSGVTAGLVRSLSKEDVRPCGERHGVDRAVQPVGFGIGVHSHCAEVCTERRFHERAYPTVEGLPSPPSVLNGRFHFGRRFGLLVTYRGPRDEPLHVAVAKPALQLQDGVTWLSGVPIHHVPSLTGRRQGSRRCALQ